MTAVFLASFIAGLLLGVRAMLFGVERPTAFGASPAPVPSLRPLAPIAAAFAVAFGIVGYLSSRPGRLEPLAALAVAALAGLVAAVAALWLVRRAAAFKPEHDPDDPRYVLQGHVATVLKPIGAEPGEVAYIVEGRRHVNPARGVEGSSAAVGTDVVIERIDEEGVAWVEPWVSVEQRL